MNPETPPATDPLFGNNPSDLMRAAIDPATHVPTDDPRAWQPPTPEDLQARLGGGYLIEEFLARGGMGAVYRGIQASLERPVAIKILPPQLRDIDPSFAQRFKQEARAMAHLNHPGIVSVYDFGEMADGTLYFVMEYIDGTDVAHMVRKQGRLSSAHAMAITAHVCDALQYAHENGVVHRDIKPANIMVGYNGSVKVADFGLAKSANQQNSSLTLSGHVMGTLNFVAPEALTLGMGIDHRADIYAVGVMLYQMLTGKLPQGVFEMPSLQVPGLDPRYDVIVASAMREDREQRYQRILDMRHALDAILTQPVTKSLVAPQQQRVVAPAQAAPPKAQPGQHYFRPPQAPAPVPVVNKEASSVLWTVATVIVLVIGGAAWQFLGGKSMTVTNTTREAPSTSAPSTPSTSAPSTPAPVAPAPPATSSLPKNTLISSQNSRTVNKSSNDATLPKPLYRFTFDGDTPENGVDLTNVLQHDGIIELNGLYQDFKVTLQTPEMNPRRFTIAARVFPDDFGPESMSVVESYSYGHHVLLGTNFGLEFGPTRNSKPHLKIEGIGSVTNDTIPNLEPGRWMTVAITCDLDNKLARAYLDGKILVDLKVDPAAQLKRDKGVGSRSLSFIHGPSGDTFKGAVDEVVVYGTALSDNQIAELSLGGENRNPPRRPVPDTDTIYKVEYPQTAELAPTVSQDKTKTSQVMSGRFTYFSWNPVQITIPDLSGGGSFNLNPSTEVTMTCDLMPNFSSTKYYPGFDGLKQVRGHLADIFAIDMSLWELRDAAPDGSSIKLKLSKGLVTRTAPSFSVTTTQKRAVRVPDDYRGKLLLLHLWPDDSSQPHVEFDTLLSAYAKYHSSGLEILSIHSGASEDFRTPQARSFPWPQAVVAENDELYNQYRTHQHSMLFFINGNTGKIMDMGLHRIHLKLFDERMTTLLGWVKRSSIEIIPTATGLQQTAPSKAFFDFRTFTNTKGQSIRAALVKISGDDIVLRKEDGTDYAVKNSTLCAADIEYLKTKGLVMSKAASAVTQPTLPEPFQASSPSEIQVKLPLVPHELAARFPEGRSFESNWSTEKPTDLSGLPDKLTSPLFNTHDFSATSGGWQQNYHLVLDDPNGTPRLFVDSNGNGNLSDDPVAAWRAGKFRRQGWKRASVGQGRAIIKLKLGDETHEVGLIVYYFPSSKKNECDSMVELDYARMGSIKVEGKSILTALIDRSSADFSDPNSSFCLDLNNDGLFSLKDEIFPVRETIHIGGHNYRLSGLNTDGANFQLVKAQ